MGISVQSNSFNYNFGCPKYSGPLISFQCAENITNIIPYRGSNIDLINDNSSLRQEIWSTLISYNNTNVPTDLAMSFQSKLNATVEVPKYKNLMKDNTFYRNYGGFGEGLIEIKGFTRFYMIKDNYLNNGENLVEITNFLR
jgi:hypothetical protein